MSDWQPIETAPKDGTVIVALGPQVGRYKTRARIVHYQRGRWIGWQGRHVMVPTHWMPLPPPPSPEAK